VRLRQNVKNAEDILKGLINDPDLNQARDIELIPTDVPALAPVIIDQLGEITAALMNRSELREARLAIEQAQVAIGVAKNQALPRLDAVFRSIIDGLGKNPDKAFSQLSMNDFHEYFIAVEFEWPIGNRGPEAALRRARYQQAQAIAGQKAQIENGIVEVYRAIRDLQASYDQIGPSFRAAMASLNQLRAIQQRQETRSAPNLEVELNAHEALAGARGNLLRVLAEYNIGLVDLERRKGTLLHYNNVMIRGADGERYEKAYRAVQP
jgi:outer membrane protein TolC